jgi:hypothetical protein
MLRCKPEHLARLMADHTQLDWRPQLPHITVRCLNVIGCQSGCFPVQGCEAVNSLIPGAVLRDTAGIDCTQARRSAALLRRMHHCTPQYLERTCCRQSASEMCGSCGLAILEHALPCRLPRGLLQGRKSLALPGNATSLQLHSGTVHEDWGRPGATRGCSKTAFARPLKPVCRRCVQHCGA